MDLKFYEFLKNQYQNFSSKSWLDILECEYALFKILSNEFIIIRKRGIFENTSFIEELQNHFSLWEMVFEQGAIEFVFHEETFFIILDDIKHFQYGIFFKWTEKLPSLEILFLIFFQEISSFNESLKQVPKWLEEKIWNTIYKNSPLLIVSEIGSGVEMFLEFFFTIKGFSNKKIQKFETAFLSKKVQLQELFGFDAGERLKTQKVIPLINKNFDAIIIQDVVELDKEVQKIFFDYFVKHPSHIPFLVFVSHFQIEKLVEIGDFDENLWELLKKNQILLPSLRYVKEFLEEEVYRYLQIISQYYRREIQIEKQAIKKILEYDWPFNLYEFYKTLETAFFISKDGIIKEEDLIFHVWEIHDTRNLNLRLCTEDLEKKLILKAYRMVGGNQVHMSKLLGISRGSLQYKITKYGFKM